MEEQDATFTDFMIRCLEGNDLVEQALVIVRRSDGSFGYKCFHQEVMDTLGMLEFTSMSVKNDTIKLWQDGGDAA